MLTSAAILDSILNDVLPEIGNTLKAIQGSLVAVLGGAWLIQKHFIRRANLALLVDALIREIERSTDDALSYWISTAPLTERLKYEQSIKVRLEHLIDGIEFIRQRYRVDVDASLPQQFMDACTGGDFESMAVLTQRLSTTPEQSELKLFRVRLLKIAGKGAALRFELQKLKI